MLPSRLFKNTGIPHRLRSLVIPSQTLPASISVQLRLRLGVIRPDASFTSCSLASSSSSTSSPQTSGTDVSTSNGSNSAPATTEKITLEPQEPRLSLTFTCTVPNCNTRSTHQFSRRSYESGIVLVECPGCKNRHLIADHLGWFKDSTDQGRMRNIEDIMKEKGEAVRRGRIDAGGVVEYAPKA